MNNDIIKTAEEIAEDVRHKKNVEKFCNDPNNTFDDFLAYVETGGFYHD